MMDVISGGTSTIKPSPGLTIAKSEKPVVMTDNGSFSIKRGLDSSEASSELVSKAIKIEHTDDPNLQSEHYAHSTEQPAINTGPEIDLAINNVVGTFSVRCHLNLKDVATRGYNVEFRRAQSMLNMKIRRPKATASIWSSGKITITGADTEDNCKKAARRIARILQHLGYSVNFTNFRVVNVLGTCSLPFGILITDFSSAHNKVEYEPELHPGATYQMKDIKATLKIFSTGSITITAPRVHLVQQAVMNIFPLVYEYKTAKRVSAKELGYIKQYLDESIDPDVDSDLDLEEGEVPSIYSHRLNNKPSYSGQRTQPAFSAPLVSRPAIASRVHDEDVYGSSSDGDLDNLSD